MGKRGPKPTGTALSAAERMRRMRERKRRNNPATLPVTALKLPEMLGNNPVTDLVTQLLAGFEDKDWLPVVKAMIALGWGPPPIDKDRVEVGYITSRGHVDRISRTVICVSAPIEPHGLALVGWAASEPAVERVQYNEYHRNYELTTKEPATILRALAAYKVTEDKEVIVPSNMKYTVIPMLLPHLIRVSKTRTIRGHRKWVKSNATGLWGFLTSQAQGESYHFENTFDAARARMLIEDESVQD